MATPKIIPYEVQLRSTKIKRNISRPVVYTNDLNSAEFQFHVTDIEPGELAGATATTLLYMRDGSFFQNPSTDVSRVGDVFSYLLKENEGNHAGIAKIQLVVYFNEGLANEQNFPTQLYEFEIFNGLETKVAQEIMIQDWTTLTREARAYIDEFAANEILRGAEFDNAQFDRNAAFNAAQTQRVITFNASEAARVNLFNSKETARAAGYDADHAQALLDQSNYAALASDLTDTLAAADANIENFDVALRTGIIGENIAAELQNLESTYAPRLLSAEQQLADIEQQISDNAFVMGVYWNKTSSPVLTRTDASVGKLASVGISGAVAHNDFDNMPIYREMGSVTDAYGNEFVKIPKFYIKKTDGVDFKTIKISKTKYPDYYLPAVFWDFENQVELPYYLHGKYKANLSADNLRLESKPATFPLQSKTIVQFRDYAKANNNVGAALKGYQQLDIHAQDVLYCLFTVEFATLNSQSIMQGFSTGRYTATDLVTVASTAANTIIVANATADLYKVGQTVSLGTSQGGHQVFYGRQITAIAVYDGTNKAITVDGAVFNAAVGNMLYNTGAKSGFSADVNASSGTPIANDGKYPCVYRGIESPWGDMWQFVDGVNITDLQAWICRNADQYTSNVFTAPYEKVGYVNGNTNGYLKYKDFDKLYPFAELPKEVGGDSATYYSDYYYQSTGQRIARVGGGWDNGSDDGLSCWTLTYSSTNASASLGGRLLKKAL